MMKLLNLMVAAILICGACVFTACSSNDDNPTTPDLNLPEKIIGKWMPAELDGQPLTSNDKNVTTFISASKATVSVSRGDNEGAWNTEQEFDVVINGNKVTLTGHPDGTTFTATFEMERVE
jgi:hypothetical protein